MALFSAFNVVCLLGSYVLPAAADLPVHCLRHQVEGEWSFVLSPPSKTRSSCGHLHPDTEDGQPSRDAVPASGVTKLITLSGPNVAKSSTDSKGTWTMVYDEGFEVNVDMHSFFAFSNFTFQRDATTHEKKNVSHCGETMVGWYEDTKRSEFGCYYGAKVSKQEPVALPATKASTQVAKKKSANYDTAVTHKQMAQKVAKLNKKLSMLQLGWKARVMDKWIGKTQREINNYAGIRRATPMHEMHKDMMRQSMAGQSRRPSFLQRSWANKLPESFDWSNVSADQIDWLEPVMDQADCGSCYAASTMRMLSTRHKISTNNQSAIPWSINAPLMCGEYNQGCKGGYPFLMTKWSSDVGLVPATCMRYDTTGTCKLECDLNKIEGKRYKAANHRYVGGFYGHGSEQAIMQELVENGPLVVSFEPAEDFMYYSDGIYKSQGLHAVTQAGVEEWEKVDHATLLVGYGVENGTKYWRIQNSWGPDWGEDGFFRMERGVDESAIESIAVAADVVEDEQNGRRMNEFFEQLDKRQVHQSKA